MSDPPLELDDAVEAWQVAGAPEGFTDRVMGAAEQQERAPARDSARTTSSSRQPAVVWTLVVALGVAAALLVFWMRPGPGGSGSLEAERRTTVELPRAVAVADPGAVLEWSSVGSAVQVRQTAGRVFYRVDPESEFSVLTSLGSVDVQGTSFEVEIETMRRKTGNVASAAAGIAVAAAVTVALYEGQVVVASDQGTAELEPGEVATLRAGRGPAKSPRRHAGALQAEVDRLRKELDAERRRSELGGAGSEAAAAAVAAAENSDSEQAKAQRVHRCAMTINGGPSCSMLHPPQEVLEHRADCGVVVYDRPAALESAAADLSELADLAGLDERERAKFEEADRSFHAHVLSQFQKIHAELGGDPELGSKLSAVALSSEIDRLTEADTAHYDHYNAVSDLYSSVLAGRQPAPTLEELSPGLRHAYFWTASGDLYEDWIASAIGESRARELREVNDGWTGNRGMQGVPHCPDE